MHGNRRLVVALAGACLVWTACGKKNEQELVGKPPTEEMLGAPPPGGGGGASEPVVDPTLDYAWIEACYKQTSTKLFAWSDEQRSQHILIVANARADGSLEVHAKPAEFVNIPSIAECLGLALDVEGAHRSLDERWTAAQVLHVEPTANTLPGSGDLQIRQYMRFEGGVTPEVLDTQLQRIAPDIQRCYQSVLRLNRSARGAVFFELQVNTDGAPRQLDIKTSLSNYPSFVPCLHSALGRMRFDPPRGGRPMARELIVLTPN